MTTPKTTLTMKSPQGTGTVSVTISTYAALNFLIGRVVELERINSDGDPGVYQKYFDELSNLGENE